MIIFVLCFSPISLLRGNRDGKIRGHNNCSQVGYPTIVLTTITHAKRCFKDSTTTIGYSANVRKEGNGTPPNQEKDIDGLQSI